MEHIVQFAISIDDEAVKKICEESAAKQIKDDILDFSHGQDRWNNKRNPSPVHLTEMFQDEIKEYIKEHGDEIVSLAVAEVARNMMKTKQVKEALGNLTEKED